MEPITEERLAVLIEFHEAESSDSYGAAQKWEDDHVSALRELQKTQQAKRARGVIGKKENRSYLQVVCNCTHRRGDHWHRPGEVAECGKCDCPKFEEAVPASERTEK